MVTTGVVVTVVVEVDSYSSARTPLAAKVNKRSDKQLEIMLRRDKEPIYQRVSGDIYTSQPEPMPCLGSTIVSLIFTSDAINPS